MNLNYPVNDSWRSAGFYWWSLIAFSLSVCSRRAALQCPPPAGHLAPAGGVTLPADGGWLSLRGSTSSIPTPSKSPTNPTAQPIRDNRASRQSNGEMATQYTDHNKTEEDVSVYVSLWLLHFALSLHSVCHHYIVHPVHFISCVCSLWPSYKLIWH